MAKEKTPALTSEERINQLEKQLAEERAERLETQKTTADLKAALKLLAKQQVEQSGPPMALFKINEKWIHPETGETWESGDQIQLVDADNIQVNIRWQPLNARAARRLKAEAIIKAKTKAERKAQIDEFRKEYGSRELAEQKLAEELLAQANGHITDLDQLIKQLEEYEEGQAQVLADQETQAKKSAAQKALDAQYAPFEKGGRGAAPAAGKRLSEQSVAE